MRSRLAGILGVRNSSRNIQRRRRAVKTDRELQIDVLDELKWEPGVEATDIGATVKDGVVTLTGTVDSYTEKWAAESAVKRVSGVKALAEELQVKLPGSSERTDADIAGAAENALEWDTSVPEGIKVTVENGFLTLEGEVDWQYQKEAAEDAVGCLMGVKGVSNLITVKPSAEPIGIKEKIEAAFKRSAILDAEDINVQADGGKVTLTGCVGSWAEYDAAESAAWAAPGVCEVNNLISVSD
jgi:osmotically-inducible protein OsmY